MTLLFLCVAGVAGILLRYGIGITLGGPNPWIIFGINVVGSFAIGLLFGWQDRLSPELRVALFTGFLGGFTTFSAYSLDTFSLIQKGETGTALLYFVLTPIFSLAATFLGAKLVS